jgi:hypothetical protein
MTKRLASTLVLVFGIAVFATSAYAGNGNGNGNGQGNGKADAGPAAADQGSAPGNSGNAPGQTKKDDAPPAEAATVSAAVDPGAPAGVKPSSTTEHDTHAAASSDDTKLYGNGKTAGQIAVQNGAKPSTVLHGPGNSQPHKAAPCSGGHEVDVHALKGKRQASCGSSPPGPAPVPGPNPGPGSDRSSDPEVHGNDGSPSPSQAADPPAGKPGPAAGPAEPELAAESDTQFSGGVLAQSELAAEGNLPFTGFPLWIAVVAGIVLIFLGLGLQRRGQPPAL